MLIRTNTLSWLAPRKRGSSYIEPPLPLTPQCPHVIEAFRQYVQNEIPVRLIDTQTLKFVERDAIFDIFAPDIAHITEEDVGRWLCALGINNNPEAVIYVSLRKQARREIIRDIVRYATFSHRWTREELSYQDAGRLNFGRQHNSKDAGTAKLIRLCETARSLGYRFVWSDTCCINRADPTELSEAIHAMFKWYAHAHVCIVHLGASLSLADFEREPWFTRGWTLQELLAPRRIKFYNKEWQPLTLLPNDKDDPSLMRALSAVTSIPRDVVVADNSRGIKGRSVWEVMSWAAPRQTTRIEDQAYCLLGLFDVHLPITYGEGDKAFPRLIKAIVARYHTWDVFAWAGEASERHPALPSSPACYPRWDQAMMSEEVGMTEFVLDVHGLRVTSVPLIPLVFVSETRTKDGSYTVTLRPRSDATTKAQLGVYGDVSVLCGSGRLGQLRGAKDLHVCLLNYKPRSDHFEGELQVGRTYVCFLLHMKGGSAEGRSTWLKFATDNVLRIACKGGPLEELSPGSVFGLQLKTTYIRAPKGQSTLWS